MTMLNRQIARYTSSENTVYAPTPVRFAAFHPCGTAAGCLHTTPTDGAPHRGHSLTDDVDRQELCNCPAQIGGGTWTSETTRAMWARIFRLGTLYPVAITRGATIDGDGGDHGL